MGRTKGENSVLVGVPANSLPVDAQPHIGTCIFCFISTGAGKVIFQNPLTTGFLHGSFNGRYLYENRRRGRENVIFFLFLALAVVGLVTAGHHEFLDSCRLSEHRGSGFLLQQFIQKCSIAAYGGM